ncbi:hypothetical protein Bca101_042965 [Brassica carinata]
MDSYPFNGSSKLVDLLNCQQTVSFGNYEDSVFLSSSQVPFLGRDSAATRREQRKWMPEDDLILISSWLNTSKDAVVGNEQKSGTFWKRVAAYFAASPHVAGSEPRETSHCKQHWHKMNDLVCKFVGSYDAATRAKTSGQNDDDLVKEAHKIFFANHNKKFTLDHARRELRNDQKWCEEAKKYGSSKKRKGADGPDTSTSEASLNKRPAGVKATKASGKKPMVAEKLDLKEFEGMWTIKQQEMAIKERTTKMSLLQNLIGKTEPLAEDEEALKKKLINDLLST